MIKSLFTNSLIDNNIYFDVDMSKYTTFKTGGFAQVLCIPKNTDELIHILEIINKNNLPFVLIGNGSNILFSKKTFEGVVIKLDRNFNNGLVLKNGNKYRVSAGIMLVKFALEVCKDNLTGIEFGTGIPGTVGGAIYMNAGCYGREIIDCCESVTALNINTLNIENFTKDECCFSYRNSFFQNDKYVILEAEFSFEEGNSETISNKVQDYKKQRTEKQPLNKPNAGSTFKRPINNFAGKLIEECGLKGFEIGGAKVSDKHAGFIINNNKAEASDIVNLIEFIKKEVYEKTGVLLELEIKII